MIEEFNGDPALPSERFSSSRKSLSSALDDWPRPCRSVTCAGGLVSRHISPDPTPSRIYLIIARGAGSASLPIKRHPTCHLLMRTLADIPIGGPEYRQTNRVVLEVDGLATILIGDATYF